MKSVVASALDNPNPAHISESNGSVKCPKAPMDVQDPVPHTHGCGESQGRDFSESGHRCATFCCCGEVVFV